MRQIFVNLKRFDVPVSMGGICPKEDTVAWTRDVIDAAVEAALSGTDEVVVLTDALGGSVNQRFSRFASDRIHVIAGVNLPLAMTVALARPDEKLDFDALVDEARQQIVYVNGASSAECEDDE